MKLKKLRLKLVVTTVLILLCGGFVCGQEVRYNYVPGTDFSKFKTYRWVTPTKPNYPNQILDTQIKQAIDSQLALRGLTKTTDEVPDLFVIYQVALDQQEEWYAYGGTGWRFGMGTATATSSTINIGTLVLDFYDVKAKQQVWSGNATKQLNPSNDPAKNQKNLQKAMAKLLKNFPPPSR